MQVDSLLKVINKLTAVLQLYRGSSLEEMLDDIYRRSSERPAGANSGKGQGSRKQSKAADKLPPEEAAAILQDMTEEQRRELLDNYIIKELKVITSLQGIKLPSKAKRNEIIDTIANHRDRPALVFTNKESEPVVPKPVAEMKGSLPVIGDSQRGERLSQAAMAIQEMDEKEIMELLSTFNKSEILEIARRNHFKISSGNNKDNIIIMLAKNLGFKDLNRRISLRSRQE